MTTITCKISDDHFSGFETQINLDYFDSMKEICNHVKNVLCVHLDQYKFETLLRIANSKQFHIHDYEFGEILIKSPKIIWICSHCEEYSENKKIDN